MDLYCEIARERLGMNQITEPDAKPDAKTLVKKVKRKKVPTSTNSNSLPKKRSLSVECIKPPTKRSKVSEADKCQASKKVTDDGFKIVSEMDLPEDDSDISDAFVSDAEDDTDIKVKQAESKNGNKTEKGKVDKKRMKSSQLMSVGCSQEVSVKSNFTDDGFRIVTNIPDDDSDVSDAFDVDESEYEDETEGLPGANVPAVVTLSCSQLGKKKSVIESGEGKSPNAEKVAGDEKAEGEIKKKKHKRGAKKKTNGSTDQKEPPKSRKKDKDKKNGKPKKTTVQLTEEDIEAIKARIPPKVQKVIIEFGLDWARFDTAELREKRELAKLPQPEQMPNCVTYLKKDRASGKVITVHDYSKKRGGSQAGAAKTSAGAGNLSKNGTPTAAVVNGLQQPGVVSKAALASVSKANKNAKPGDIPLTKEQLELIEKRKQMKAEHLDELRSIKRNVVNNVINKSLDPRTKDQRRLAVIEKLGGVVKKPYLNYKVLMANKKKEKEATEAAKENLKNLGMHDLLKKKRRERRKKDPNEVSGFNSLGGRIRDGVMVINKKDVARLSS